MAVLLLASLGLLAYRAIGTLASSAETSAQVEEVLQRLGELSSELEPQETPETRSAAISQVHRQVNELRRLAAYGPGESKETTALAKLVTGEAVATAGSPPARLHRQEVAEIQRAIQAVRATERERLKRQREAAAATARQWGRFLLYGASLGLLLFLVTGCVATRSVNRLLRLMAEATARTGGLKHTAGARQKEPASPLWATFGEVEQRVQRALAVMRDEVRKLECILHNLSSGVIVAGPGGEIMFANRAAVELLGVGPAGAPLAKTWERDSLYLPDAVTPYPLDQLPLQRALRGETVDHTEVAVRPPDAPEGRWLSISARPLAGGAEAIPQGAVIVLTEITARRRAEAALRDSERLLRAILENLPVGIWVADPEGNITLANPASQGIWGGVRYIGPDGYEEYRAWEAETGELVHAQQWPLARAMATGQPTLMEVLDIQAFDGAKKTIRHAAVPVRDGNRQLIGFLALSEDITESQHRKTQIEELNRQLMQRARDLEAVNQELEAFCWSVSHDLRAPLRGIEGFSRALLEDYAERLDEEGKGYLQRVCAAAARMARLIDDLLKLSRLTRSEMRLTAVDLTALAQDVAAQLQQSEPERQVEVLIKPGLAVNADASLLRIVMENLMGNAWKFTRKQARARIEVGAEERHGWRRYYVRDNGAGFDMTYADKLFKAFQRLHGPAEFEGTGIGLATVQRIIQRHGGQVGAEGAVGQGATFYFSLV